MQHSKMLVCLDVLVALFVILKNKKRILNIRPHQNTEEQPAPHCSHPAYTHTHTHTHTKEMFQIHGE